MLRYQSFFCKVPHLLPPRLNKETAGVCLTLLLSLGMLGTLILSPVTQKMPDVGGRSLPNSVMSLWTFSFPFPASVTAPIGTSAHSVP